MEKNTFQRIHEIIESSDGLSLEEKRDFTELFAQTKEVALKPVLKLLENDTTWVEKLYLNYIEKKDAYVTGSMDAWKDAIHKERAEISK